MSMLSVLFVFATLTPRFVGGAPRLVRRVGGHCWSPRTGRQAGSGLTLALQPRIRPFDCGIVPTQAGAMAPAEMRPVAQDSW